MSTDEDRFFSTGEPFCSGTLRCKKGKVVYERRRRVFDGVVRCRAVVGSDVGGRWRGGRRGGGRGAARVRRVRRPGAGGGAPAAAARRAAAAAAAPAHARPRLGQARRRLRGRCPPSYTSYTLYAVSITMYIIFRKRSSRILEHFFFANIDSSIDEINVF